MKGQPAQGTLEMECVFTNTTAVAQRFLYCTMLGLKDKPGTNRKAPAASPKWVLEAVGDTYKSKQEGTTAASSPAGISPARRSRCRPAWA